MDQNDLTQLTYAIDDGIKAGLGDMPSLRDRFAMSALQGVLASDPHTKLEAIALSASEWAECAYALADAMIVARRK